MQVSSMVDNVLGELKDAIAKPETAEFVVPESELLRHAKWMTEHRGYIHTKETLNALLDYKKGYGLFIRGPFGSGKSSFFTALGIEGLKRFSLLDETKDQIDKVWEKIRSYDNYELVIDDLGREQKMNNYHGFEEIVPWIVEHRMYCKKRTHFTTNMNSEDFLAKYDDAFATTDRIRELCKIHVFSGPTHRKPRVYG